MKMYLRLFAAICLSPIFALVILSFYAAPLLSLLPKRKSPVPDNPYKKIPLPASAVKNNEAVREAEAA